MTIRACLATCLALLWLNAYGDAVDDYIRVRMAREHIPGLSLAVVQRGKVVKLAGYGYANLEHSVRSTPTTIYELASTTKSFVAVAVLLLQQEGRIQLNDRVDRYVTNVPETWRAITVRQLLSHTSGIPDYLADLDHNFTSDAPPEDIVKYVAGVPLKFAPGTRWSYSNTAFVLLGMIIKKACDKPFDEYLADHVFKPLRMKDTQHDSPDQVVCRKASGYLWFGGSYHNADFLRYMMTNLGDRGILSTVADLVHWNGMLMGDKILSKTSKAMMWSPVAKLQGDDGREGSYGLGWFLERINGHRQFSHPGGAPGIAAMFSYYPDDDTTVIILANGGRPFMQELDLGIAKLFIPGLFPERKVELPVRVLDATAGYFNAYGSTLLKVWRRGGQLSIDDGGGLNNDFTPISRDEFVNDESNRSLRVTRDDHGQIVSAKLKLGPDVVDVQRLGPLASSIPLPPSSDQENVRTIRTFDALQAMARGGTEAKGWAWVTDQSRSDFSHGGAPELARLTRIKFLTSIDVSQRGVVRHGSKVSQVDYYRATFEGAYRFVLVYSTKEGQIADEDVVDL